MKHEILTPLPLDTQELVQAAAGESLELIGEEYVT